MVKTRRWMIGAFMLLVPVLLYFVTYVKSGDPLQCLWRDDRPYELYSNGVANHGMPFDGSPSGSISLLGQHRFEFGDDGALVNVTDVIQCDNLKYAWRLSFAQIHSEKLSAALAAWRGGGDNVPQFRSGQLLRDKVDATYTGDPERHRAIRNPTGALPRAPAWLPKEQVNEQNFIAFWGDGQLFKGRQPHEYYFIGYRGYVPGATPQQ